MKLLDVSRTLLILEVRESFLRRQLSFPSPLSPTLLRYPDCLYSIVHSHLLLFIKQVLEKALEVVLQVSSLLSIDRAVVEDFVLANFAQDYEAVFEV